MRTITFAFAGFGSIAKTHALGAFDANLRLDLPFIVNPVAAFTRSTKNTKINSVKNYQCFEEMLEIEKPDFLDVCTPNQFHFEYAKIAMEKGINVYCEKPLSNSCDQAVLLADLAKKSTVRTAIAFMYRFLPAVNLLKEALDNGIIGNIINFHVATYHSSYLGDEKVGSWRVKKDCGGGALVDLGSHSIDLIQYLLGDITEISAKNKIHFQEKTSVDEYSFCNVVVGDDIHGTLEVSRISAESDSRDLLEFFGEHGCLKINLKKPHILEYFNAENGITQLITPSKQLLKSLNYPDARATLGFFQSAHTASLSSFAQSIFTGEKSLICADFDDGLKVQKVLDMAYNSIN